MAKFVKNHWARLIILTAAACQAAAAVSCIFWPKIIFDTATVKLNILVKPQPFLQIIILVFAVIIFVWELPLNLISGTAVHRSIPARLVAFCLSAAASGILYQGTEACLYTCIGIGFYAWGLAEGEVMFSLASSCCLLTWKDYIPQALDFFGYNRKERGQLY
ncbi:hypothetical protein N431DRAFT_348601 [Stipitochalara longipes BDJ]|nr:hypothetical protein N431DRAFT_348601 [Stipitochalara longipes BDJ]